MSYRKADLHPDTAHYHVRSREWDSYDINTMHCELVTCTKPECEELWEDVAAEGEWVVWRDPAVRHLMRKTLDDNERFGDLRVRQARTEASAGKYDKGYAEGYADGKEDYA